MGSEVAEGLGIINWWGFSPALDLSATDIATMDRSTPTRGAESTARDNIKAGKSEDDLNLLLVGTGDGRHLLRTLACARRRPCNRVMHFWVVESCMELVARQILFLILILAPAPRLGLRQKTEMFLELFASSHIRSQTSEFLADTANLLVHLISEVDELHRQVPVIDVSRLKYRERDDLEGIFQFWRQRLPRVFDMSELWDYRLRRYALAISGVGCVFWKTRRREDAWGGGDAG